MGVRDRMKRAWNGLLGRTHRELEAERERALSLARETAALKLELDDLRATEARLKERLRDMEAAHMNGDSGSVDNLFADLSGPLSQLRMQSGLMDAGREISAASVIAVARRVADTVENAGLEPIHAFGAEIPFDPITCEPLTAGRTFSSGEGVMVAFIGYRHNGRVIRKALVQVKE